MLVRRAGDGRTAAMGVKPPKSTPLVRRVSASSGLLGCLQPQPCKSVEPKPCATVVLSHDATKEVMT
jgi:hypothetical protein